MITIHVRVDSRLRRLVEQEGEELPVVAARLLARAVRAARPRMQFDTEAIRAANAAFVEEDELLAESAGSERAALLAGEDQA